MYDIVQIDIPHARACVTCTYIKQLSPTADKILPQLDSHSLTDPDVSRTQGLDQKHKQCILGQGEKAIMPS